MLIGFVAVAVAVAFADSSIVVLALPELYGRFDTTLEEIESIVKFVPVLQDGDLPNDLAEGPVAGHVADAAAQIVCFLFLERHEDTAAQRRAGDIGQLGR